LKRKKEWNFRFGKSFKKRNNCSTKSEKRTISGSGRGGGGGGGLLFLWSEWHLNSGTVLCFRFNSQEVLVTFRQLVENCNSLTSSKVVDDPKKSCITLIGSLDIHETSPLLIHRHICSKIVSRISIRSTSAAWSFYFFLTALTAHYHY
jgi:hypothetical protein